MDVAVSNQLVDGADADSSRAAALLEQKWERIKPAPFSTPRVLALAWIGTAIAGGLFPVVLICWGNLFEPLVTGSRISWEEVFAAIPAFVIGFIYAGIVACPVTFFAWACALMGRTRGTPIWLGSLIGGWTGFICTLQLGEGFGPGFPIDLWIAVALGQVGAGTVAMIGLRANRLARGEVHTPQTFKVSLSQLLGWTTAACITAALIGAMRLSHEQIQFVVEATCLQLAILLISKLWSLVHRRRLSARLPRNVSSST
jgi:hypothetical protein